MHATPHYDEKKVNDQRNVRIPLHLKTITPVHIGSGKTLELSKDVLKEKESNTYYIVDWDALTRQLDLDALKRIASALQSTSAQYHMKIFKENNCLIPIGKNLYGRDFKLQLKTTPPYEEGRYPIIPGSSLKGALRTLLMVHFDSKFSSLSDAIKNILKKTLKRETFDKKHSNSNIDNKVIGTFEHALTRFLQLSDFYFHQTSWWSTRIIGATGGWKEQFKNTYNKKFIPHKFATAYECIDQEQEAYGYISIVPPREYTHSNYKYTLDDHPLKHGKTAKEFVQALLDYTRDWMDKYLKREIAFFKDSRFDNVEHIDKIIKSLNELKNRNEKSTGALLRLGQGTGFHAMTGDWQYDDHLWPVDNHKGKVRFKTRKIAFTKSDNDEYTFYPMGFVEITIPEEKEALDKIFQIIKKTPKNGGGTPPVNGNGGHPPPPTLMPYRIKGAIDTKKHDKITVEVVAFDDLEYLHTVKAIVEYVQDDGSTHQEEVLLEMRGYKSALPKGTIVLAILTPENHGKEKPTSCKYFKKLT